MLSKTEIWNELVKRCKPAKDIQYKTTKYNYTLKFEYEYTEITICVVNTTHIKMTLTYGCNVTPFLANHYTKVFHFTTINEVIYNLKEKGVIK